MITGVHTIVYSSDAAATRAFFRDVLGWRAADAGGGWLIFATPPGEIAAHPTEAGEPGGKHQLFLMCDDVERTMKALKARGVRFTRPVADRGWGLLTSMRVPGIGELNLYEPRHASPLKTRARRRPAPSRASARPRREGPRPKRSSPSRRRKR